MRGCTIVGEASEWEPLVEPQRLGHDLPKTLHVFGGGEHGSHLAPQLQDVLP